MTVNNYQRAWDATIGRASNPNPAKTFKAWQKDAVAIRNALKAINEMFERDREEALQEYSSTKATQIIEEMQKQLLSVRADARSTMEKSFEEMLDSKRETIGKHCADMTDADIRILTALKMRTKISEAEIIHAAEQMSSNFYALGTLADIAADHKISIPIYTIDVAEENLAKAEAFGREMIQQLETPDKSLNYSATCFYLYPDIENGPAAIVADAVDNNAYTTEQLTETIERDKLDMASIVNRNATASEVQLREGNYLANIALQFGVKMADIEAANPGRDLENLHPGDRVIVPSTRFKIVNGRGFASPDQVSPIQTVDSKLDRDVFRSAGQVKTALKAGGKTEVTVGDSE